MLCLVALAVTGFAQTDTFRLTDDYRRQTLDALYKAMDERYVLPEVAKKIEIDLRKRTDAGEFKALDKGADFAMKINDLIKAQVTDAHLRFRYSEQALPPRRNPAEPSADEQKRQQEMNRFMNAGFEKVERLAGNIGYISFDHFDSPENMKRPVAAAFTFLADTDAMIVDLRHNGGGDPSGVQLFCSYFFAPKPVHLNSIYFREGDKGRTTEFWTLNKVDGPRYADREVYVLTSKRTGSGAEECAYDLQNLKRSTTIGSSTWGGANPGGVVRLNDHFSVFVPSGRAINPYTKTNWEGVGVKPDIDVDPETALKRAQVMAIKNLMAKANADKRADLEQILREVEGAQIIFP